MVATETGRGHTASCLALSHTEVFIYCEAKSSDHMTPPKKPSRPLSPRLVSRQGGLLLWRA